MKKCPKCKAEIQENARFCLYCMTSFEEKQTIESPKEHRNRWPSIIAAILVVAILVCGVFVVVFKDNLGNSSDGTYSDLQSSSPSYSDPSAQDLPSSKTESSTVSSSPRSSQTQTPSRTESSAVVTSSSGTVIHTAPTSSNSQTQTTSKTEASTVTSNPTISNPSTPSDSSSTIHKPDGEQPGTSSSAAVSSPVTATVNYFYRDAEYGDDFSVGANLENCVVITGVKTATDNGTYSIPGTIDGKKVIAIMPLAFSDTAISETVKKVIVPASVKTIWDNAFANCYNLTDIYFRGDSIYTATGAFPDSSKRNGTLTIHCSANCSDRNLRYYKNSASNYGAEYAEWNG